MKSTSESQLTANRANAQLSTGPTSSAGRRAVRLNAVTHGYAGQTVVIPDHEAPAYANHFASFRKEYAPVGPTEEFLVQSLADLSWSASQIRTQITNAIAQSALKPNPVESGDPRIDCAISQARNTETTAPSLNTLSTYEQRKMRLFFTTRKELLAIQTERKAKEKEELEQAAELRKADNATRQPGQPEWQPNENGFVCSLEQIDRYIKNQQRQNRQQPTHKKAA